MRNAFTLIELIVTIVIVGILATLGISQYSVFREKGIIREAGVALRLIRAAQQIWRSEVGSYYGPDTNAGNFTGAGSANAALRLDLNETNWDYDITDAAANTFEVTASRTAGGGSYSNCVYFITEADNDIAVDSGNCLVLP